MHRLWVPTLLISLASGCRSEGDDPSSDATDITNAAFTDRSGSCSTRAGSYVAEVSDLMRGMDFTATVEIEARGDTCVITSNGIPNHDFNDTGAFATPVSEVIERFTVSSNPSPASRSTDLSLQLTTPCSSTV